MTQETMGEMRQPVPSDEMTTLSEHVPSSRGASVGTDIDSEISYCSSCGELATHTCQRCKVNLCEAHSYHEDGSMLHYCRACADRIVGVCDVCDALHARPCRECGKKVCDDHRKQVIERWGWGGVPGQGGFTDWFPVIRTYCQEHGRNRVDIPKPALRRFTGYDGSSPEW